MMTETFLTKPDLAKRWGVTRRTIERYMRKGRLPAVTRIGGKLLFPLSAIEAQESACTIDAFEAGEIRLIARAIRTG